MNIIELILDEENNEIGIEAISVVENPAIEEDFIALNSNIIELAEADKEKIMEAVQAGVDQYLVKPFNAMQLEEKIKAIKL